MEAAQQRYLDFQRELQQESKENSKKVLDEMEDWQDQEDATEVEERSRIQQSWDQEQERLEAYDQSNQRIITESRARLAEMMKDLPEYRVTNSPHLTEEEQRIEQGVRYHGGFSDPSAGHSSPPTQCARETILIGIVRWFGRSITFRGQWHHPGNV